VTVLVGGLLQGWVLLTGNLPAMPDIFTGPLPTFDGTSSQAHRLFGDEFNWKKILLDLEG